MPGTLAPCAVPTPSLTCILNRGTTHHLECCVWHVHCCPKPAIACVSFQWPPQSRKKRIVFWKSRLGVGVPLRPLPQKSRPSSLASHRKHQLRSINPSLHNTHLLPQTPSNIMVRDISFPCPRVTPLGRRTCTARRAAHVRGWIAWTPRLRVEHAQCDPAPLLGVDTRANE